MKVAQGRPVVKERGEERSGGATLLLCLQVSEVFQREDIPFPCPGKEKLHLGQHESHKGLVAELSPAAGGKDLGGILTQQ